MKAKLPIPRVQRLKALLWGLAFSVCALAPAGAAPNVSGSDTQLITDKVSTAPFDNLGISSASAVTVTIAFPSAQGALSPLPPFFSKSGDTYTLSSTNASGAAAFLKTLSFTPVENRVPVGSTETTTFTIIADDGAARATNTAFVVVSESANDLPTVTDTTPGTTIFDKDTATPFSNVKIEDPDPGTLLDVTISLFTANGAPAGTNGVLQNLDGFSQTGTNIYKLLNRSPADAQAAVRALVFRPRENFWPVGTNELTRFQIFVEDAPPNSEATNADTTVTAVSWNDPPTITGTVTTTQQVLTGSRIFPFAAVTLSDVDAGGTLDPQESVRKQPLTIKVALTGTNIVGSLSSPDFSQVGTNYVSRPMAPSEATTALGNLAYVPPPVPLPGPVLMGLNLTVTDDPVVEPGKSAVDTATKVEASTPYQAVSIRGTQAGRQVSDKQTIAPFSTVTLESVNGQPIVALISLDSSNQEKGQLINLGGFVHLGSQPDTYAYTNFSEAVSTVMRQLLFQPVENRIAGSNTETTVFTIRVMDQADRNFPTTNLTDSTTTTITVPANDRPTIAGVNTTTVTITDSQTLQPFPAVTLAEVDELGRQNLTVTVSLDDAAKGAFLPLGGVTAVAPGTNRLSGVPTNVTALLRQLTFKPTPDRLPVGLTETVAFNIRVQDDYGGSAENPGTHVRVLSVNGAPVIRLPSPQPISLVNTAPIRPFLQVEIEDDDTNLVVLVGLPSGAGVLTNLGGFTQTSPSPPAYQFAGYATNATAAIQQLEFLPLVDSTTFTISATDSASNLTTRTLAVTLRNQNRTFLVTNTLDYYPDPTNTPIAGSLRRALVDAGENDHIAFALRSLVAGAPDLPAVIRLKAPLVLNKNVTINGPGADLLAISGDTEGDGTNDLRVFEVEATVTIQGLTVSGGFDPFAGGGFEVTPEGSLTLRYCAVTNCVAGQWGGGIDVDQGGLSLDHCLIYHNATASPLGQGGGGVSIFSTNQCFIRNTTFSGNSQESAAGLGGGALYVENANPALLLVVHVTGCTFKNNRDNARKGSAIRTNVAKTSVRIRNTITADGRANNLQIDQTGAITSLGGNISDDATRTLFSSGGFPYDVVVFDQTTDRVSTDAKLLPLTNNLGPTWTHALAADSPAIGFAVNNDLGTDQRGYWRSDGHPDSGAFEYGTFQRVVLNEIFADAPASEQFLEFYVPRDADDLDLTGFQVFVSGILRHTFSSQPLPRAIGLVLRGSTSVPVPDVVSNQVVSTGSLELSAVAGSIALKNPAGQTVLAADYVGIFEPSTPPYAGKSINLNPDFAGFSYIPQDRVVGGSSPTNSPGKGSDGSPLGPGNAPPTANPDLFATDEDHPLLAMAVLANDFDPDRPDIKRVVGVTNSALGATVTISNVPTAGASVNYDPLTSPTLQSLPEGAQATDTFTYLILDYLGGTNAQSRGTTQAEIDDNTRRATAVVTVTVLGVNDPPTPADDLAATTEDAPLVINVQSALLDNDSDPDTDDDKNTLLIDAVHLTPAFSNTFVTTSALGATVTLEIRFNRLETNIRYDPTTSTILNALSVGETTNDTFYYSVVDRHGAIGTAAVHVTVTGVNDAPVADSDTATTDEDTASVISFGKLFANDTDVDTDDNATTQTTLQVSGVDALSLLGAQVSLTSTGVVYNPAFSASLRALARKEIAFDSFAYRIMDGAGGSSTGLVSIRVVGVNDTPIAVPDTFTTTEDDVLNALPPGVLANDIEYDINGAAPDDFLRTIPTVAMPTSQGGLATIFADGTFKYDPTGSEILASLGPGEQTNDTFSYTVLDRSLTIANDDFFTVKGDSANNLLGVLNNDTILSNLGGSLAIAAVGLPSNGGTVTIAPLQNALIYSPQINFAGVETFTYTVADGKGGADTATVAVKVDVTKLNGRLTANADKFTVARGTSATLDVLSNDRIMPDDTVGLTIVSVSAPNHGGTATIDAAGNLLAYAAASNFVGEELFSYVITGGGTASATGSVTIAVVERANALNINEDTFAVLEDSGGNLLDPLANDTILPGPGPSLTITDVRTNGTMGRVEIVAGGSSVRYTPPTGFSGDDLFNYDLADGAGGTAMALVRVRVLASGFTASPDIFTVARNTLNAALPVLGNDNVLPGAGETLQITTIGIGPNAPNHGGTVTMSEDGSGLRYTPAADFVGVETFTYEITDGTLERAVGQVTIRVVDRRNELKPGDDFFSVTRNSVNNALTVLVNDALLPAANSGLQVIAVTQPNHGGTALLGNGVILYTPQPGFIGSETFNYTIADRQGGTGSATVTVEGIGVFTNPDIFSVLSGSTANELNVLANDNILPDTGAIYAIAAVDHPAGGTISLLGSGPNNRLVYTPNPGFAGTDRFNYYIVDATGKTNSGTLTVQVVLKDSDRNTGLVTITVLGKNDPPIISGTIAGQTVYQRLTIRPFAGVTITEIDHHGLQPLIVTVRVNFPTNGYLATLGGFSDLGSGLYRMGGTTGVTAAAATTALRGLTFVPTTSSRVPPGGSETTTFTIGVDDSFALIVTDTNTSVVALNAFTTRLATVSVPANDNYGQPVAASRDTVVVGAPFDRAAGGQAIGSAYVFVVRSNNFSQWDLPKIIQAPIPLSGDQFGFSVAIDRDTIVVGAPLDVANGIASGTAYVFSRHQGGSNQWGFVKKLVATDAASADQFGNAVAVSGDTIAVGAHLRDDAGNNAGGVYLFERNLTGPNQWGQSHKTIDPQGRGGDEFGYAVSLSGDTLAVGAPFDDDLGSSSGTISMFERNYNPTNPTTPLPNNWGLRKHLVASDGAANDAFGFVVSLHGTVVVVGAPLATVVASGSGAAYAFARDTGGSNNWGQVKKIVPTDGAGSDQFGSAVAFYGDTVVIGAKLDDDLGQNTGSAYVFRRNFNPAAPAVPATENWGLIEKFLPLAGGTNSHFGFSVALSGDTVVVGSSFETSGQVPDATYIFRLKFNNSPVFAQPIPDLVVTAGSSFTYTIPLNLVGDSDVGDGLIFSAALTDGSSLPVWLSFNPLTRTISGSPGLNDIGSLSMRVLITDQDFGTGSDVFQITVNPLNPAPSLAADYDGQVNLYEYAFVASASSVSDPVLSIYRDAASGHVYLVYRCRNNDPRLKYGLEATTDFRTWTTANGFVDPVRSVPLSEEFANIVLLVRDGSWQVSPEFFRVTVHFLP